MIGIETTPERIFTLEVTESELRILSISLSMALKDSKVNTNNPENRLMHITMQKLLVGE